MEKKEETNKVTAECDSAMQTYMVKCGNCNQLYNFYDEKLPSSEFCLACIKWLDKQERETLVLCRRCRINYQHLNSSGNCFQCEEEIAFVCKGGPYPRHWEQHYV